ncbi:MAG: twin-arginine translocase TatA/TatE family subunit [Chloroflexota bacterium]|nr:twin-arginine translocase TatA/TatE family subunit [Chloroflexota bacterium]
MFGIGVQEMLLVGLLFLVIFGPSKLPEMARDLGRFVNEARRSVEEFKEDLVSKEDGGQEPRKKVRGSEENRGLEETVRLEKKAAIDRSAGSTEEL